MWNNGFIFLFSPKTQRQREAAENLQNKGGEAGAEEEPEEEMWVQGNPMFFLGTTLFF